MSTTVLEASTLDLDVSQDALTPALVAPVEVATSGLNNYKGFVGGVFSGIAKLSGMNSDTASCCPC